MRTFARKQDQPQMRTSFSIARSNLARKPEVGPTGTAATARFAHDFSRIPVRADSDALSFMESGPDFSGIRVHTSVAARILQGQRVQDQTQPPQPPSQQPSQLGQHVATWQRVIVTSRSDIQVDNCGNHDWYVDFSLATPAATGGWVIQELEWVDVDSITGETGTEHFWEAWFLPARTRRVPRERGARGNDHYMTAGSPQHGQRTFSGVVRYYPLAMMPGATSTTIPGFTFPGVQTNSRPDFWTGSGGTPHRLNLEWDCRPGHTRRPTVQSTPRARVRDWPHRHTATPEIH